MANIIKKITGFNSQGKSVVADAAVTNMYTDENGDLNIKTSTELGDTDDAKVVITSKEIDLNADTIKANDINVIQQLALISSDAESMQSSIQSLQSSIQSLQQNISAITTESLTALSTEIMNLQDSIFSINNELSSLHVLYVNVDDHEELVEDIYQRLEQTSSKLEDVSTKLDNSGILDYEPNWKEFFNTIEESLSIMRSDITFNNIAIQKIADHLNYDGIYETE